MTPKPKSPGASERSTYKLLVKTDRKIKNDRKINTLFLFIVNGYTGLPSLPKDVSRIIYALYKNQSFDYIDNDRCNII